MYPSTVLLLATIFFLVETSHGSNIAMFSLSGSPSHKEVMYGIAEGLTRRNHTVTYYTIFPASRTIEGVTEVYIESVGKYVMSEFVNLLNENGARNKRES